MNGICCTVGPPSAASACGLCSDHATTDLRYRFASIKGGSLAEGKGGSSSSGGSAKAGASPSSGGSKGGAKGGEPGDPVDFPPMGVGEPPPGEGQFVPWGKHIPRKKNVNYYVATVRSEPQNLLTTC